MSWAILIVLVLVLLELLWIDHMVRLHLLDLLRSGQRREEAQDATLETLQEAVRELKRLQGR